MEKNKEYYIGLDIGTDSVGYAVTDERYKLIKYKGEPMWGSHLFDNSSKENKCADRRLYRNTRRRIKRIKQRISLVDEIFAPEVAKVDPKFYVRKMESALCKEDKKDSSATYLYFNDKEFNDKRYHEKYPTIHHLICDLMNDTETVFDIRLINIAVDWLVAHRGHFLSDVSTDNLDKLTEFKDIYEDFKSFFEAEEYPMPWGDIDIDKFGEILKERGINNRKNDLMKLLYGGRITDNEEWTDYIVDRTKLVEFLAGKKVKYSDLFKREDINGIGSIAVSDDMSDLLPRLGEDAEIIARIVRLYDWSVLSNLLKSSKCISEEKVKQYEQHKEDLKRLKEFVKRNKPDKYNEIFKESGAKLCNYTAYSYNTDSIKDEKTLPKNKAKKEDFYDYLKKTLNLDKFNGSEEDELFVEDVLERMKDDIYMPKQVNGENRAIPYQLYYDELKKILENAKKYYPFLLEKDKDGYSNIEKLLSIMEFRVPYYVGPLYKDNDSKYAWIERKAEGKIYPWNFDEKVDREASERAFIDRMTNQCQYLPGEKVLPKWSTLYAEFMVLNEINNLKHNDMPIDVKVKQMIYEELFCRNRKVTIKAIESLLLSRQLIQKGDKLTGIDVEGGIKSSLKPLCDFHNLLEKRVLTMEDVDEIIRFRTYTEDKKRYRKWLKENYSNLNKEDFEYVCRLKYSDFGRLSKKFLKGIKGINNITKEEGTIIDFLWKTNDNLMEILSDKYTFSNIIKEEVKEYYLDNPRSIKDKLEDMGLPNPVKRQVTRTLDVLKDVVHVMGNAPKKIFVEMTRGGKKDTGRTVTRKAQILALYDVVEEDISQYTAELPELKQRIEGYGDEANNRLQKDALFLYYVQLGKCMYCGKSLDPGKILGEEGKKGEGYCNVDHIRPQWMVKDDSLDNKVLVCTNCNERKGGEIVSAEIRHKMYPFWKHLFDKKLIKEEKYSRLMRSTNYSKEEKLGFIGRQLVETGQATKAITQLLRNMYPSSKTEIVYVKANLPADFRKEFNLTPKSRIINDLHHAKDAYLNVVAGNVYHERFTKKWFSIDEEYSLKTDTIFNHNVIHGDKIIWDCKKDLSTVKNTYEKNSIHLTRYAYCKKGQLFDVNLLKKKNGQIERKEGFDIDKYGGYNAPTISFFVIAKYLKGGKREVSFVPVRIMDSDRFLRDKEYAKIYIENELKRINSKKIENVELALDRIVKFKSVLSLDGYKLWLNRKHDDKRMILSNAESLVLSKEMVFYTKRIENYNEKKKANKLFKHDENNDGLSKEKNLYLYDELTQKLGNNLYKKMPVKQYDTLVNGREKFIMLDFDTQISTLMNCISLLKSGNTEDCNLEIIGGSSKGGQIRMNIDLSNYKGNDLRIIDMSPSGIYSDTTINLLELLK